MQKRICKTRECALKGLALMALMVLSVVAVLAPNAGAQVGTTTVQGTVYRADGTPAGGTLLVSWPAFTTSQNQAVAAGSLSALIGANGFVSVNLTPNAGAIPAGVYYTVAYHLNDGTVNREYWTVPASGTATIGAVRATLEPATVAVQPTVTPAYVQGTVASMASSYLPLAGGTLGGPLTLNTDPTAQFQAATKHYADSLAANDLPLTGGTLTGSLSGPNFLAKQLEGQFFADQWETNSTSNDGITMSVTQCASLPYACHVVAPALYTQLEQQPWGGSFGWAFGDFQGPTSKGTPPSGGCTRDDRWGPPQWICTPGTTPEGNRFSSGPTFSLRITSVPQGGSAHIGAGLTLLTDLLSGSRNMSTGPGDQVGLSGLKLYTTESSPASVQAITDILRTNSDGDAISISTSVTNRGGIDGGDNEGVETQNSLYEANDVYQGTINSITTQSGTGYPNPCTAPCNVIAAKQTQGAAGIEGAELQVVDISKGDSSGTITSTSGANNSILTNPGGDWDAKWGDSNFQATLTAAIDWNGASSNPFPRTNVTVTYSSATGSPVAGQPACLFDTTGALYECNMVTAVNATAQTITFAVVDHAINAGAVIAQGGMTGMGLVSQASCVSPGAMHGESGSISNTICPTWPVMYNSPGGVAYMYQATGSPRVLYSLSFHPSMGTGGTVTVTLNGGSVATCSASGGTGYSATIDNFGNLNDVPALVPTVNSGATAPVLYVNGVSGGALKSCGILSAGSGITSISVAVQGNPYTVYPMTRAVNVWNPTTGAVDGSAFSTDALMPSANFWAKGDLIQQPHYFAVTYTGKNEQIYDWQPGSTGPGSGAGVTSMGGQIGYGYQWINYNSPSFYSQFPAGSSPYLLGYGLAQTPAGLQLGGPWRSGFLMQMPPFGGDSFRTGALIVDCGSYCSSWSNAYNVLNVQNANDSGHAEDVLTYNPSTEAWNWTAGSTLQSGLSPGCSIGFSAGTTGGFSITCGANTSKFDTSGNLTVQGSVKARGTLTAASINGEVTVDGTMYTTLNAAWNAAVSQANTTGQNQAVRLGPGTYPVTTTLTEPANGTCVSLLGSGGTTVNADSTQVATTLTVPNSLNGDVFYLGNAAQAQGCTFRDLNILAQAHATRGFELQWFRGLLIDNVAVNDTTAEGILLGEESTAAGHQSNFLLRNVTVSYSSVAFTPANRAAYGIHLQKTAMDSEMEDIVVRNALTAAVYNEGTGITGYLVHGFGYPYTCTTAPCVNNAASSTAANASYATSYVIYDAGGSGDVWTDTYVDSPAVAGFYIGANGVAIHGGHIQWPDLTSFPAANLAYVASTVTNNLLIADVDCLGMNSNVNWITYAGTSGNPPTYASVHHLTGCGNYYQALEPAQVTGFSSGGANINDPTSAVPRVWSTPIAAAANYPAYAAQLYTGYQGDAFQAHFSGVTPFFNITSQGTIRSNGGIALSTVINTASTLTLTAANKNVIANASGGAQTITLPSCYTPLADRATPTGLELTIIKSDSSTNAVMLQTVSSQTIDYNGATGQTLSITAAGKRTLVCGPDYNWYAF